MEEQKLVERPLMSEDEFKDYIEDNRVDVVTDFYEKNILHLRAFDGVRKYKSVRRAIKRGHVSLDGLLFPNRPFNNRSNSCDRKGKHSRGLNERKKIIYEQLKYSKSI